MVVRMHQNISDKHIDVNNVTEWVVTVAGGVMNKGEISDVAAILADPGWRS